MAEENKQKTELKEEKKDIVKPVAENNEKMKENKKPEVKHEQQSKPIVVDNKPSEKKEMKTEDNKKEEPKKEEKVAEKKEEAKAEKKEQPKIVKKEEAIAKGMNLHASKKHCMYICDFIKGKSIDTAIKELEGVIKLKQVIPYKGEIPHRKRSQCMMSGRYPVNASIILINILKALKGNCLVNGLDLEKARICYGSSTWAARPARAGGVRAKRTHVILKAKEFENINKGKASDFAKQSKSTKMSEVAREAKK